MKPKGGTKAVKTSAEGELPAELDFFKYAKGGSGTKRKAAGTSGEAESGLRMGKKRKTSEDTEEEDDEDDEEDEEDEEKDKEDHDDAPLRPKQRVTAKGSNVPAAADTFEDMAKRYHIPPLIMSNIAEYGYQYPTGIQSHGIPILMEVRLLLLLCFALSPYLFLTSSSLATSPRYHPQELVKPYPTSYPSCPNSALHPPALRQILAPVYAQSSSHLHANSRTRSTTSA